MKKISLSIAGKNFDITLDETHDIETEIAKDNIKIDKTNDIKTLLQAYLSKCYEHLSTQKELKEMIEKIENLQK